MHTETFSTRATVPSRIAAAFTSLALSACTVATAAVPAILTLAALGAAPAFADPPGGQRNVLILVADDYGIDRSRQYLSLNGNTRLPLPATPNIRRLRTSGIAFDNAWANPVCSPTRAGFLTGRHSFRTGVANWIPATEQLEGSEVTIAELISSAGYTSGLFGKWHVGGSDDAPLQQGFDEHSGTISGKLAAYDSWEKIVNGLPYDADPSTPAIDPETQYATEAVVDDALDWIDRQDGRWLAIAAFNAPHTPLHTPTPACDGVASQTPDFNAVVECLDFHIGRFLDELDARNVLDETTVIFFGDNGTEPPNVLQPFSNSPNPSEKLEVYEGGIRVPFVIADGHHLEHGTGAPFWSGVGSITQPGRREGAMVHTVDVFATVAEIAGLTSTAHDSVSMIPYLTSASASEQRETNYTDRCDTNMFQAAIRGPMHKLVYRLAYLPPGAPLGGAIPTIELYATSDLEEQVELSASLPILTQYYLNELALLWASEGFDPVLGCSTGP